MATFSANFYHLLEAQEKDIFFKSFTQIELLYPSLFMVKPSSKAYEDRLKIAGLGTFVQKEEGTPVSFDDPVQGTKVRTVHATYALGFRVTMEMLQDDQFGIINQMPDDLGDSARDHQERIAWGLINDGFTGTTYTGLEGDTLFTSTHTNLKDGATQSNIQSPAVALGVTGIESMMTQADVTTSDEGRFVNMNQSVLLIHPNNKHRAFELLETEFKVDSANNNRSTVAASRSGLKPLAVPYLNSNTRWSIHDAPAKNGLRWYNRMAIDFREGNDSDTFDRKYYGVYRASVEFNDWRGSWGSNF